MKTVTAKPGRRKVCQEECKTLEEVEQNGKSEEIATHAPNVLQEYFSQHELLKLDGEPRLIIHE